MRFPFWYFLMKNEMFNSELWYFLMRWLVLYISQAFTVTTCSNMVVNPVASWHI